MHSSFDEYTFYVIPSTFPCFFDMRIAEVDESNQHFDICIFCNTIWINNIESDMCYVKYSLNSIEHTQFSYRLRNCFSTNDFSFRKPYLFGSGIVLLLNTFPILTNFCIQFNLIRDTFARFLLKTLLHHYYLSFPIEQMLSNNVRLKQSVECIS